MSATLLSKFFIVYHVSALKTSCAHRIQSQFDHLSETYFNNFEYDLGERELGYAQSLTMTWRCSPPPWVSSRRPLMPYSRPRVSALPSMLSARRINRHR